MTGLVVVYVAVAFLLTWLLIDSRVSWRSRAAAIIAAPVCAVALWVWWPNPVGWPTSMAAPKAAQFAWAIVDEPDAQSGDPGAVFLWLVPADATQPRAFRLPYSRQLHKQVQEAMDAVKHGVQIQVRREHGRARTAQRGVHGQRTPGRFHFYPRPAVVLPPKS